MNRIAIVVVAGLVVGTPAMAAESAGTEASSAAPTSKLITRGKYLVEQMGMCADCHSPRDQKGQFIREKWLQGSVLDFKNTVPMPKWAGAAPPIAGLPGWTAEQGVTFLMTGKSPSGETADPPMPEYRMNRDDATAVVTYLKSLPAPGAR